MSFFPQVVNHNNMILKGRQDKDDKAISHSYLKKKKNHIDSMHTSGRVQYKAYVTLNITGRGQRADFFCRMTK